MKSSTVSNPLNTIRNVLFGLCCLFGAPNLAFAVDINTASSEEIADALNGVGLTGAASIVAYRDNNGPFNSIDELTSVKGIGPATLANNLEQIELGQSVHSSSQSAAEITPSLDLNTATASQLSELLSGIGPDVAMKIITYRDLNGPFNSIDELVNVEGIGQTTVDNHADLLHVVVTSAALANDSGDTVSEPIGDLVNVNTGTQAELETLSLIGPMKAKRIIAYRDANGRINTLAELQAISGIGARTIELNQLRLRF